MLVCFGFMAVKVILNISRLIITIFSQKVPLAMVVFFRGKSGLRPELLHKNVITNNQKRLTLLSEFLSLKVY